MLKTALIVAVALLLVGAFYWEGFDTTYPPGVLIPNDPAQIVNPFPFDWRFKGCKVSALASCRIRGRVLLTTRYFAGQEASMSPLDMVLGWRLMSDQQVLDQLNIRREQRNYRWSAKGDTLPIPEKLIIRQSANIHMVPSNSAVAKALESMSRGDLVDIRGYLVSIVMPDGNMWISSLSREDTGESSSELMWVNDALKLPESR
jgi:hypothetical protein